MALELRMSKNHKINVSKKEMVAIKGIILKIFLCLYNLFLNPNRTKKKIRTFWKIPEKEIFR